MNNWDCSSELTLFQSFVGDTDFATRWFCSLHFAQERHEEDKGQQEGRHPEPETRGLQQKQQQLKILGLLDNRRFS